MKVEIINYKDNWLKVKQSALVTINKSSNTHPTQEWKKKILRSQHSPIRLLTISALFSDVPSWIATHFSRHHIGVNFYQKTQRTDRTGIDRSELKQDEPVNFIMDINAQSIINISKQRLCLQSSRETTKLWLMFVHELRIVEPELAEICVPNCIWNNHCFEFKCCGYIGSDEYTEKRNILIGRS